jgi:DNA replication protein DnaD
MENLPQTIREDFYRDLLDQSLRKQVSDETLEIRNLILAQAFSNTSLLSDEKANYHQDPLNIRKKGLTNE